ncbi:hypothetical protein JY651_50410 [Pyxidicoccus parkwayensis]|uniref:Uncharacterized protein n=1 Tax=Pyxidicoccus parkwayensis TaxID=2813578 RepID=A0ABX7P0M2_9BACT|nr:hypothetical protein [Pyxidicoccus parkwaysis]QSQ23206.1 hypothetical protein JY651_50410 [Pyxidicoccus parkwaysis]
MPPQDRTETRRTRVVISRPLTFIAGSLSCLVGLATAAATARSTEAPALHLATSQPAPAASRAEHGTAATLAPGAVELSQSCAPQTIPRLQTTRCEVTVINRSFEDVVLDLDTTTSKNLHIFGADGATIIDARHAQRHGVSLAHASPGVPTVAPGSLFGYIPLDTLGVSPTPIGDEQLLNFDVPAFQYAGQTWTRIGVDSNGYIVVGGGTPDDNNCCDLPGGPSAALPNNILAPFWTDLDGGGAPGIFLTVLTDGVSDWVVVEFRLNVFGTNRRDIFQVWIGVNGVEDITYAYDPNNLPIAFGAPFLVGAENTIGEGDMERVLPTQDLRVTTSAATAGGSASYVLTVRGQQEGAGTVTTDATGLSETLTATTQVQVTPKK